MDAERYESRAGARSGEFGPGAEVVPSPGKVCPPAGVGPVVVAVGGPTLHAPARPEEDSYRALEREREELRAALAAGTAARLRVEAEFARVRDQIAAVQAGSAHLQSQLARVSELKAALHAVEGRLHAKTALVELLTRERDELQRQLSLARVVATRKGRREDDGRDVDDASRQIAELEESLAAGMAGRLHLEAELGRAHDQLAEARTARAQSEAWLQRRSEALAEVEGENERQRARVQAMEAEFDRLHAEHQGIAESRAALQALRAENLRLQSERDGARAMLVALESGQDTVAAPAALVAELEAEGERLRSRLRELEGSASEMPDPVVDAELMVGFIGDAFEHIDASEQFLLQLEKAPQDREIQDALLRIFHTMKGAAAATGFADLAERFHEGESLVEAIRDGAQAADAGVVDRLLRLPDGVRDLLRRYGAVAGEGAGAAGHKVVRVEAGRLLGLSARLDRLEAMRSRIEENFTPLLVARRRLSEWQKRAAQQLGAPSAKADGRQVMRDAASLFAEMAELIDTLAEEGSKFGEISTHLQDDVDELRLSPLEGIFRRLRRPVRDAARQTGRLADLVTRGGDQQIDRSLADALYSPLLHLVRNAVAHGIEPPELRERRRKSRTGTVRVVAGVRHQELTVSVEDDGGGIDLDRVLARAVERRLVNQRQEPTRDQLIRLIFRPGFSTATEVDGLAGRGVGMDVVAQQVRALDGRVSVETEDGRGTTVRLTFPLASAGAAG